MLTVWWVRGATVKPPLPRRGGGEGRKLLFYVAVVFYMKEKTGAPEVGGGRVAQRPVECRGAWQPLLRPGRSIGGLRLADTCPPSERLLLLLLYYCDYYYYYYY